MIDEEHWRSPAGLQWHQQHIILGERDPYKQILIDMIVEAAPERIVEIGTGFGQFLQRLYEKLPVPMIGLDIHPECVAYAREHNRYPEAIEYQTGSVSANSPVCVIAAYVLNYLKPDTLIDLLTSLHAQQHSLAICGPLADEHATKSVLCEDDWWTHPYWKLCEEAGFRSREFIKPICEGMYVAYWEPL